MYVQSDSQQGIQASKSFEQLFRRQWFRRNVSNLLGEMVSIQEVVLRLQSAMLTSGIPPILLVDRASSAAFKSGAGNFIGIKILFSSPIQFAASL